MLEKDSGQVTIQINASEITQALPPHPATFVGRQAELQCYLTLLEQDGFAIIRGVSGVGKSTLAARLLGQYNVARKFWWSLYLDINNNIREGIWDIAQFLANEGDPIPWNFLQTELHNRRTYPLKVKLGNIIHHLEQVPTLICIDNFHLVEPKSATNSFIEWLYDRIRYNTCQTKLLVISQTLPGFSTKRYYPPLEGLSLTETETFCIAFGLVPKPNISQLYHFTDGNPHFLETLGADATNTRCDQLPEQVINYLNKHCYDNLPSDEKKLMALIASSSETFISYKDLWSKIAVGVNSIPDLGSVVFRLINKHLLKRQDIDRDFVITINPLVRSFYHFVKPGGRMY